MFSCMMVICDFLQQSETIMDALMQKMKNYAKSLRNRRNQVNIWTIVKTFFYIYQSSLAKTWLTYYCEWKKYVLELTLNDVLRAMFSHLGQILAKFFLEQRQYMNNSTEFRCMLILKLPPFFPHRIAEWKRAAILKETFIWFPSSCS